MATKEGIGLSEAIRSLRKEIHEAMDEADPNMSFELGDIELEFQLAMTREGTAKVEAKFWVLELGGVEGKLGQTKTHSIKLKLKPMDKHGKPIKTRHSQPD